MGSFKVSTGLRNYRLGTGSFAAGMSGFLIKIYGSATSQAAADALIPATADAAIGSATLLCTVSVDGGGTGGAFGTPASGVIAKAAAETWTGTNVASGYASFYRGVLSTDTGALSTTEKRVQGTVGTVGKDLIIANAYMTSGVVQPINSYSIGDPAE